MTTEATSAADWLGRSLGERTVTYTDRDVILYALAVGARATDLDLVFEERLRVLPTFALTLAQWAPDVLGERGAWDVSRALHGTQRLEVLRELPPSGEITMSGRVSGVWDKGAAAIFDVEVSSDYFLATWSIFAPGSGGFGGERGPGRPPAPQGPPEHTVQWPTAPNQAALYRLLGDRHHIHIDPAAAAGAGMPRPILHGLCTMASATLPLAACAGAHPADLRSIEARFNAPVFPGDTLEVRSWADGAFEVHGPAGAVVTGARVSFGRPRAAARSTSSTPGRRP